MDVNSLKLVHGWQYVNQGTQPVKNNWQCEVVTIKIIKDYVFSDSFPTWWLKLKARTFDGFIDDLLDTGIVITECNPSSWHFYAYDQQMFELAANIEWRSFETSQRYVQGIKEEWNNYKNWKMALKNSEHNLDLNF